MTVQELIERLSELPPGMPVYRTAGEDPEANVKVVSAAIQRTYHGAAADPPDALMTAEPNPSPRYLRVVVIR